MWQKVDWVGVKSPHLTLKSLSDVCGNLIYELGNNELGQTDLLRGTAPQAEPGG